MVLYFMFTLGRWGVERYVCLNIIMLYFVCINFGPRATTQCSINSANIECKKKAQFILILIKEK